MRIVNYNSKPMGEYLDHYDVVNGVYVVKTKFGHTEYFGSGELMLKLGEDVIFYCGDFGSIQPTFSTILGYSNGSIQVGFREAVNRIMDNLSRPGSCRIEMPKAGDHKRLGIRDHVDFDRETKEWYSVGNCREITDKSTHTTFLFDTERGYQTLSEWKLMH